MVLVDVTQPLISLVLQDIRATDDSFKRLDIPKLFFQTVFYSGKENTRLYTEKTMKIRKPEKNSSRLILDTHNVDEYLNEHLKWEDLQISIQRQCMENKNY